MNTIDNDFTIDKLLETIDKDDIDLEQLNKNKIQKIKNDMLQQLQLPRETLKTIHKKLKNYRYVSDLADLKYGAFIRWIPLSNPEKIKLTNGGIVVDIKIFQTGIQIVCKNNFNRIFQLKLDECLLFQKLTNQEQYLLTILHHLTK